MAVGEILELHRAEPARRESIGDALRRAFNASVPAFVRPPGPRGLGRATESLAVAALRAWWTGLRGTARLDRAAHARVVK